MIVLLAERVHLMRNLSGPRCSSYAKLATLRMSRSLMKSVTRGNACSDNNQSEMEGPNKSVEYKL